MKPFLAVVTGLLLTCATLRAGQTIQVAAAVSLRESFVEIAKQYENDTGDRAELTFGSSGQLAAQIKSGAPIDVFVSAANAQVEELSKANLIDDTTRRTIAGNELVLVAPRDSKNAPTGFAQLAADSVQRIAVGEPRTVPAGQYAQQVLRALDLNEKVRDRLIYGANVRQVLDYVIRGEVSAGIVYKTDAIDAGEKVRVIATADPKWHEPIVYPAAVIRSSARRDASRRFLDYLGSDKAMSILQAHGFTPASPASPTSPTSR